MSVSANATSYMTVTKIENADESQLHEVWVRLFLVGKYRLPNACSLCTNCHPFDAQNSDRTMISQMLLRKQAHCLLAVRPNFLSAPCKCLHQLFCITQQYGRTYCVLTAAMVSTYSAKESTQSQTMCRFDDKAQRAMCEHRPRL